MLATVASFPAQVTMYLTYYLTPEPGGLTVTYPGTAGDKLRKHDSRAVRVQDLRSCQDGGKDFTLDRSGFQLVGHDCAERDFHDPERVKTVAYEETEALLKKATGASKARQMGRCHRGKQAGKRQDGHNQSYAGALQVLQDNTPQASLPHSSKCRRGIINVWHPLGSKPITRDPLAVCDRQSFCESDVHPVLAKTPSKGQGTFDNVSPGGEFETWNIVANPEHKWDHASRMRPDEALLINCFDSKTDGRARCSPHSAFKTEFDEGGPRESCEVRCLVFWEAERC
ncbi:Hydroxylase/desaturase asaB [Pseudocercospora fuligena]|uniref:Hydroxylase/desaturase asaB n=1 Tax=Pseudocercospora fuligena TaxID=685502 RepID=A0A8H6R900_9PEZI|nr:Hydroxylase/desaturase asaB [Pseudocercospora fuligena]